jgi:DNA-binding CsgD family transcriptional regulator
MSTALRNTGLSILGKVPWGTHLCLFQETKDDLLETLVPYFKAGLERNEFCIWAVSEPLTEEEARIALSREIPAERQLETSVEILPGHQWYLKEGGADPKKITSGWHEKLRGALAKGFDGIRVSGNAFWLGTKYWKDFAEYERELGGALAGRPMIVLCTYPLPESRAADVLDVARAHEVTAARRNGHWEFIETAEAPPTTLPLTPRELDVLTWVGRGKSSWEIGEILGITKRTVDEHAQAAVHKLGATNRTQAVAIAVRGRLIDAVPFSGFPDKG